MTELRGCLEQRVLPCHIPKVQGVEPLLGGVGALHSFLIQFFFSFLFAQHLTACVLSMMRDNENVAEASKTRPKCRENFQKGK